MLNLEVEEQTHSLTSRQNSPIENCRTSPLNLLMVGMAPLHSYPLDSRIGGQGGNDNPSIGQFLTREQTRYIYRKVETGEIINTETIEQEMEQEEQLSKIDDTNGETNPYQELIVNNAEKIEPLMTQMEQW